MAARLSGSFVVVRLGSVTAAYGLVEHDPDVDDHP